MSFIEDRAKSSSPEVRIAKMGSVEDGGAPRMFCRILNEQLLSSKKLVWLGLPIRFFKANHEMLDSRQVILENSGCETWEVVIACARKGYAGLRRGWDDFACDNGLSVGDVVVFELVKPSHFHVTIFGKNGEEKQPGLNAKASTSRKRRKSDSSDVVIYLTDDDEPSEGQAAAVRDGGAANGCSSSKEKDAADTISRQNRLNISPSVTMGLSAAYNFQKQLKNPSCVKIIPATAVTGSQIQFGKHFGRLLPDEITTINLITHKALQSWPVRWLTSEYPKMSSGWHAFAKDNRLNRGDICIFEVLEAQAVKVHIFKQQEQQTKSPRRQTRSIMQALQKNKSKKEVTMTEETVNNNMVFEISMTSLQGKEEANRILASKYNLEMTNQKICFLKDETGELRSELTAWMPLERSKADFLVAITFPNGRALLEHLVKEVST